MSTAQGFEINLDGLVTEINSVKNNTVPVGTIIWSSNATVPAGYLLCNGSAVGRSTYPELFSVIGTTFGEGDGSSTFNLPNLIGKFVEGNVTAGIEHEAGLPDIEGELASVFLGSPTEKNDKALSWSGGSSNRTVNAGSGWTYTGSLTLNASDSNPIYGNSDTVQPSSVTALPCIKAFSSVVGDATVVVGNLANDINTKVALDGSNLTGATVKTVVETWHSGTEWYRVWSDGWIEQGGIHSGNSNYSYATVSLYKNFSSTSYSVIATVQDLNTTNYSSSAGNLTAKGLYTLGSTSTKTVSTFILGTCFSLAWYACGY